MPTGQNEVLPGWLTIQVLLLLAGVTLLSTIRTVQDADLWWHLEVGKWIVSNGTVPTTDPLSIHGVEKEWIAYSWLYEVSLYGLYEGIGLWGIILYRALMGLAILAALYALVARQEPRFLFTAVLLGVSSFTLVVLMNERPWLISILFAILTMIAILDLRAGKYSWVVFSLPLIYLLWANTHIQFIYGFFLLFLAVVSPLLDHILKVKLHGYADTPWTFGWWFLVGISFACFLATLINPYFVGLYKVIYEYATQKVALELIREMMALEFRFAWEWIVLGLAFLTAFRLGRKENLSSFDVLLFLGAAYFTFRSRRDIWFMVLAAATLLPGWAKEIPVCQYAIQLTPRRLVSLAVGVFLLAIGIACLHQLTPEQLSRAEGDRYPRQAVLFVQEKDFPGPLFNSYDWGGYLAWKLPMRVSIDGRANLHGGAKLQQSWDTWSGKEGWRNDPDLLAANLVIAKVSSPLTALLRSDPTFSLVHEDQVAAVFIRKR